MPRNHFITCLFHTLSLSSVWSLCRLLKNIMNQKYRHSHNYYVYGRSVIHVPAAPSTIVFTVSSARVSAVKMVIWRQGCSSATFSSSIKLAVATIITECSETTMRYPAQCVFPWHWPSGLLSSQDGPGIFNARCVSDGVSCARQAQTRVNLE